MNEDLDIDASAIGGVGEGLVATWALQVGITPNRVERDKHGWDYSMEFPRGHSRHGTVSLDLVPCEIRCFVQVKTITSRESRVQIALSNWNRMAKDPTPWFIVVVVLDEKLAADAAFLVHVDRVWVGRVLKRLRELPEASSLHDRYLELTWDDSQRFPNLHGTSLRDGIRFHVGSDLNAYVAEKKTWIETVGYEESRHQVQMSFSASSEDEMWEMLADAAVGLRRELPIKTFRAEELRFDLPKEVAASEED